MRFNRIVYFLAAVFLFSSCAQPPSEEVVDCSVGECGPEREIAERKAEDPDFDLSENHEIPDLNVGDDIVITGELNDVFAELTFQAQAGEWFDISVYSLGLPYPSFVVERVDIYPSYRRWSPEIENGLASRSIVTPQDGEYTIRIYSETWGGFVPSEERMPSSDDYWAFVLQIESRSSPQPEVLQVGDEYLYDAMNLRSSLFRVEGISEDALGVELTGMWTGGTISHSWQYREDLSYISNGPAMTLVLSDETPEEGPLFLADYIYALSLSGAEYTLQINEQYGVAAGESIEEVYQVEAGQALVSRTMEDLSGELFDVLDVDFLRDGEVVASFEGTSDFPYHKFPGAYYVSEDGGDYVVRFTNSTPRSMIDIEWEITVENPNDLGSTGPGDQLVREYTETLWSEHYHMLSFEVLEDSVVDISHEGSPAPVVRIFEGFDSSREIFGSLGDNSGAGPFIFETGTHHALIHGMRHFEPGPTTWSSDGYELILDFSTPPDPFEHQETMELEKGQVVVVSRPSYVTSSPNDMIYVSAERDGAHIFGPAPVEVYDFVRFPAPENGIYDVIVEGPLLVEELEADLEFDIFDSTDLGLFEPGDYSEETTLENGSFPFDTVMFEVQEPVFMSWRTFGTFALPTLDVIHLTDELPTVLSAGEGTDGEGRLGGLVEPGTYIIDNQSGTVGGLGAIQGVLRIYDMPQRFESTNIGLDVPVKEIGTSSIDVTGCGAVSRVSVHVDFSVPTDEYMNLELALESPSGSEVFLVDTGIGFGSGDELIVSIPDELEPAEPMESLYDGNSDGLWELRFGDESSSETPSGRLNDWSLDLWCEN